MYGIATVTPTTDRKNDDGQMRLSWDALRWQSEARRFTRPIRQTTPEWAAAEMSLGFL